MGRIAQRRACRGSQRWLQHSVEVDHVRLDEAIGLGPLEWLSPLACDDFSEYRDQAFLDRLGIRLPRRPLQSFWPPGGPVWDGLARTTSGVCVLVEAKAHIAEMKSTCGASSPKSMSMIQSALEETQQALGLAECLDWCSDFYQYANRVAHAYLLNELNGVPTMLTFVYFVGDSDVAGPDTRKEWEASIAGLHGRLGITGHLPEYVREAFVDVTTMGSCRQ